MLARRRASQIAIIMAFELMRPRSGRKQRAVPQKLELGVVRLIVTKLGFSQFVGQSTDDGPDLLDATPQLTVVRAAHHLHELFRHVPVSDRIPDQGTAGDVEKLRTCQQLSDSHLLAIGEYLNGLYATDLLTTFKLFDPESHNGGLQGDDHRRRVEQ
jgi:hypothetical protein